jgi:hypothetical protein
MGGELVKSGDSSVGRSDDALELCNDEECMCMRVRGTKETKKGWWRSLGAAYSLLLSVDTSTYVCIGTERIAAGRRSLEDGRRVTGADLPDEI